MSGWRALTGGAIDRGRPIAFRWNGRAYKGFAGDTLASALMANGVSIVGRSFKYHRPRGLLAAGLEEPNGIVQLETADVTVPNLKATQIELYEGLQASAVNAFPRPEFDLLAVNSLVKRFIPAAFYYKTFMWPKWRWFEPSIRKAAGLGTVPSAPDPDRYEHRFAHVDVLVVGSGAAGLAAAEAAALENSCRVMLVEADMAFGGGLLSSSKLVENQSASAWVADRVRALRGRPNVQLLNRAMAFGYYDHGLVALCERLTDHLHPDERTGPRQRLWKVRCKRVILATGAFERPIAFSQNDLPGVMLASAAQTYARRFGSLPGERVVICTTNDSAYDAAFALQDAGCEISLITDTREKPGSMEELASQRGIEVMAGATPLCAIGRRRVTGIQIGDVHDGRKLRTLACDAIATSEGWSPAVHLHSQSGGSLVYDDQIRAFLPYQTPQHCVSIGAAAGILDLDRAIHSGRVLGAVIAPPQSQPDEFGPVRHFADGEAEAQTAWLDYQNDVTVADVQLASRENFRSVEHLKRYTTLGMASDQGKTSNVAGIHVLAHLLGKPPQAIGTTKFRPPFDPVTIGAFAGRATGEDLFPLARVASHDQQIAAGAQMEPYGGWLRASSYRGPDESEDEAVSREVLSVRKGVGLFDASPLGKIEVKGPDAAEFLQRMYVNDVRTLKLGRCRYGLMLNEHGIVYDDGVFARLEHNHFLVGTTSGHAAAIAETFEEWLQCEWPELRVMIENVTTGWSVMNLAGPNARDVLRGLGCDFDLSPTGFPHMSCRVGKVAGVNARVQRVSFTGELSYEVAVPWRYGPALWDAMTQAGQSFGITPFGVEALMVMRIEKGFLHVGSDTDGTTYPQDVGFSGAIANKIDDFVGRRSAMRPDAKRNDRRQLVGVQATDGNGPFATGAHVLAADATVPSGTQGWITSSAFSPSLKRPLAMALVEGGERRLGEPVTVWDLGELRTGRIVDPRALDPAGERLRG